MKRSKSFRYQIRPTPSPPRLSLSLLKTGTRFLPLSLPRPPTFRRTKLASTDIFNSNAPPKIYSLLCSFQEDSWSIGVACFLHEYRLENTNKHALRWQIRTKLKMFDKNNFNNKEKIFNKLRKKFKQKKRWREKKNFHDWKIFLFTSKKKFPLTSCCFLLWFTYFH